MVVGAGAVEGAWGPVIAALRATGFPDLVSASAANFALARLVYVARLAERDPETTPIARSREEVRAKLAEVKTAIARQLTEAASRDELRVRAEFAEVAHRLLLVSGSEMGVITTNWDSTVERAVQNLQSGQSVHYVHGHMEDGGGLYLPAEVAEEPYRERQHLQQLLVQRRAMVRAITNATRLIIYGLGLSALDAELGQILASGIHQSSVREIVVVNPQYVDVADRLATLNDAGSLTMPIRCYLPDALDDEWRYSAAGAAAESARIGHPDRRPA
jgi:hypothetical protein